MPLVLSNHTGKILLPLEDECVQCHKEVALGTDYCPGCADQVREAAAAGRCAWCNHTLTRNNLYVGFCQCGLPLNNAPPLNNVPAKADHR